MRCRNCGKVIPNGTLCEDCYNVMKKQKVSEEDNVILMTLGRKFLPKYHILVNWEWLMFCLFVVTIGIFSKNFLTSFACIIVVGLILGVSLFINKRIAMGTKIAFYETKVIYRFNLFFIHRKKVMQYSEIRDITLTKRRLQKKFGLGNINVISKKTGIVFNGIIIEDVANCDVVFKKLTELIGTKIG